MDVTAGTVHATPGAPLQGLDPSVAPDSGILTNVAIPSATRILNPTAIALDNAAGTGAPFDKKDSVYGIYQKWTEKSITVNGSVLANTELLRISLNPSTLPARLRDWVSFHRSCIPAIDVAIVIGGAAGTISWLALGWLPDDSMKADLDNIQQVACEHINMNTTITTRFVLNDNRRSGLFRRLPEDPEPYPCMVLLVNRPALNVQRNDDVNYPIDVYVRFAPNAIFMEPFNSFNADTPGLTNSLDLRPFFKTETTDFLIGSDAVNNTVIEFTEYPDHGWNTGTFSPTFDSDNFVTACVKAYSATQAFHPIVCLDTEKAIAHAQELLDKDEESEQRNNGNYPLPVALAFAFGKVPSFVKGLAWRQEYNLIAVPVDLFQGTLYTVPDLKVKIGGEEIASGLKYVCRRLIAYEYGCILILEMENPVMRDAGSSPFNWSFAPIVDNLRPSTSHMFLFTETAAQPIEYKINYAAGEDKFTYSMSDGYTNDSLVRTGPDGVYYVADIQFQARVYVEDRFPTWTYILTNNFSPSSNLPVNLKYFSPVRSGTTALNFNGNAFWALLNPDMQGALLAIEAIRGRLGAEWITMDLMVNDSNFGQLVYSDRVIMARCPQDFLIRTSVSTNIRFDNIRAISNPSLVATFPVSNFHPWNTTQMRTKKRFGPPNLSGMRREASMGIMALAGGMNILSGAMQGAATYFNQRMMMEYYSKYQDKQLEMAKWMQESQNENRLKMQREQFGMQMDLIGASSRSAMSGNLTPSNPANPTSQKFESNHTAAVEVPTPAAATPIINGTHDTRPQSLRDEETERKNPIGVDRITSREQLHRDLDLPEPIAEEDADTTSQGSGTSSMPPPSYAPADSKSVASLPLMEETEIKPEPRRPGPGKTFGAMRISKDDPLAPKEHPVLSPEEEVRLQSFQNSQEAGPSQFFTGESQPPVRPPRRNKNTFLYSKEGQRYAGGQPRPTTSYPSSLFANGEDIRAMPTPNIPSRRSSDASFHSAIGSSVPTLTASEQNLLAYDKWSQRKPISGPRVLYDYSSVENSRSAPLSQLEKNMLIYDRFNNGPTGSSFC